MIQNIRGNRCLSVKRFQHRLGDRPSGEFGPLELGWANGRFTTLDANADWTLDVSCRPWVDPFADAAADDGVRLADEVGLWEPAALSDDLRQVIGRTVTATEPILNEVGELSGLEIAFGDVVVLATIEAGNLVVRAGHR